MFLIPKVLIAIIFGIILYFVNCQISQLLSRMSDVSRVFLGRPVHIWNAQRHHHGCCRAYTLSKLSPNALKMHSKALSALRFLCKTFSKLLKFVLRSILSLGWFLRNSHIQKQNLYGYKHMRGAKQKMQ